MSVGRICTRSVDTADHDESVQVAAGRMAERGVGALVVLDRARSPIGIVTDRDLVLRVLAEGKDPTRTRIGDVMTSDPRTVTEKTPIEQALALMRAGSFRRLPVLGHDGALAGLVSLDDILALLAEEFADVGALVDAEMPARTASTRFRGSPTRL